MVGISGRVNYNLAFDLTQVAELDKMSEAIADLENSAWTIDLISTLNDHPSVVKMKESFVVIPNFLFLLSLKRRPEYLLHIFSGIRVTFLILGGSIIILLAVSRKANDCLWHH